MTQFDKISRVMGPQPPLNSSESGDDRLDLSAVFLIARRQFSLIFMLTTLLTLLAMPLIMNMDRNYTAQTRLLLQDTLSADLLSSDVGAEDQLNLNTEVERLLSRDVSVRVVRELGLDELPEFNPLLRQPTLLETLKDRARTFVLGETGTVASSSAIDGIIPEYLGRLNISRISGTDIINIEFSSKDPELAASVSNALVQVYLSERKKQVDVRVNAALSWLDIRVNDQGERVVEAITAARTLRNQVDSASVGVAVITQDINELNGRRTEIDRLRAVASAKLAAVGEVFATGGDTSALDSLPLQQLDLEQAQAERDLNRLLKIYGSNHSDIAEARAGIRDIQIAAQAEILRLDRGLRGEIAKLDSEAAVIEESLAPARAALLRARVADADVADLQRVVEVEQATQDRLEEQRQALEEGAELPVAEVEVLSPASVPLSANGHGRLFYLLGTVVVAGSLAVALGLFRELIDTSVRSSDQLLKIPSLTTTGLLPQMRSRTVRKLVRRFRQERRPFFASAIREVIFFVEQANKGKMPPNMVVTSALAGEGKTTVAAALAVELAAAGHRVLLVDGDVRHGSIHTMFGTTVEPGFTDYLLEHKNISDVIRRDDETGVELIPRGKRHPSLHMSRQLVRALVDHADSEGQILIFDSAPVLASSETPLLASVAHDTLVVVRWGKTTGVAVESAARRLLASGCTNLHAAINQVNLRRQALYGYTDAGVVAKTLQRYQL